MRSTRVFLSCKYQIIAPRNGGGPVGGRAGGPRPRGAGPLGACPGRSVKRYTSLRRGHQQDTRTLRTLLYNTRSGVSARDGELVTVRIRSKCFFLLLKMCGLSAPRYAYIGGTRAVFPEGNQCRVPLDPSRLRQPSGGGEIINTNIDYGPSYPESSVAALDFLHLLLNVLRLARLLRGRSALLGRWGAGALLLLLLDGERLNAADLSLANHRE